MGSGHSAPPAGQAAAAVTLPEPPSGQEVKPLAWFDASGEERVPERDSPIAERVSHLIEQFNEQSCARCRYWMQLGREKWLGHSFWTKAIMSSLWIQEWAGLRGRLCNAQTVEDREPLVIQLGHLLGLIVTNNLELAQEVQAQWHHSQLCRFRETFEFFNQVLSPPRDMLVSYILYATEPYPSKTTVETQYRQIRALCAQAEELVGHLQSLAA